MSDFDDIEQQLDRIGVNTRLPLVHAIFVQDHSGSMDTIIDGKRKRSDLAKENFNEQLSKIQRESKEVETTVTLIEFDERIFVNGELYRGPGIQNVKYANEIEPLKDWWSGGMTALLDAVGTAINIGKNLVEKNGDRDQSVLVVIFTDGDENCSGIWGYETLKHNMKELEETGIWTFTFIGGEIQVHEMMSIGLNSGNTMSYNISEASDYDKIAVKTISGLDKYYQARKIGESMTTNFFEEDEKEPKWQNNTKENT
jgi:hypothetical protein